MNDKLRSTLIRYTDEHRTSDEITPTAVHGLHVVRRDRTLPLGQKFYEPALIAVVSGCKDVMLGDERAMCGENQYFGLAVGMPIVAGVTRATPDGPYLAVALTLDLHAVGELLTEMDPAPESGRTSSACGLFVGSLLPQQRDALGRLGSILYDPPALRALYPAITREIFYWALAGPDGAAIRRLAATDGLTQRIAVTIQTMRADLTGSIGIEQLAEMANMSRSSFYEHFKTVTSMSPLQYQKRYRLAEARRLMLADGADVTRAAQHVGYESASQFSREYTRMFGAPPRRDIVGLRSAYAM